MSDLALARDYLARIDPSVKILPREFLINELKTAGLAEDGEVLQSLFRIEGEYIDHDQLKALVEPAAVSEAVITVTPVIDENALARNYLAQIDEGVTVLPREFIMKELSDRGLGQDSPLMLMLDSMEGEYIDRAEFAELVSLPPMELTEGDKALMSDILDPIAPNQPLPMSNWQAMLYELELGQDHPFLRAVNDRPKDSEMTREQIHALALESGLPIAPLAGAIVDPVAPEVSTETDHSEAAPPKGAGRDDATPGDEDEKRKKEQKTKREAPAQVVQGVGAALFGIVSLPFSGAKKLFQARRDSPDYALRDLFDEIHARNERVRKDRSKASVEALAEKVSEANKMLSGLDLETIHPEMRKKMTESIKRIKETVSTDISPDEKKSMSDALKSLMDALSALFSRLNGKSAGPSGPSVG